MGDPDCFNLDGFNPGGFSLVIFWRTGLPYVWDGPAMEQKQWKIKDDNGSIPALYDLL